MVDVGVRQGGVALAFTSRRRRTRQAGFTLLEILVTIVIVGLLMVLLSQGVRFGLVTWGLQLRDDRGGSDLESVDRVLRELIGRMDPGDLAGNSRIAGDANSLRFSAKLPYGARGLTPIRRARILIEVDRSKQLTLFFQPYIPAPIGPEVPARHSILLEGVEDLNVAYWQPPDTRQPGAWRSVWNARDPPGLIRFRITLAHTPGIPQPTHWPDIIVAPMRVHGTL